MQRITFVALTVALAMLSEPAHAQSLRVGDQGSTPRFVSVHDSASLRPATITIECWVKPIGPGFGQSTALSFLVGRPPQGQVGTYLPTYGLYYSPDSKTIYYEMAGPNLGVDGQGISSISTLSTNSVTHVAITYDGASIKLYINGVLDNQAAATFPTMNYPANEDVLIGAAEYGFGYNRRFDGMLDEVRIWNVARSAADIASNMNVRFCGPTTHLAANWSFTGGSLTDTSGNGNNGAAVNSVSFPAEFTGLNASGAFTLQPVPATVCPLQAAHFTVNAAGVTAYQWQSRAADNTWKNVHDTGLVGSDNQALANIQGSSTASIQITPTRAYGVAEEFKVWRCVVTGGCGDSTSNTAALNICVADMNCDQTVDLSDFFEFFNAFDATSPAGDINGDGTVDLGDFFAFFNGFDASC